MSCTTKVIMKDKKKNGKQKNNRPAQYQNSEGPKQKRLQPVSKSKYKISRYQFTEDLDDEDDQLYQSYLDDED